jgi:hypothetical protein
MPTRKDNSGLVGGVFLILMGTIFLLDRLDVITFRELVRTWWPMSMIVFGLILAFDSNRDTRMGAFFLITIGAIFQIGELDLFPWWRWKNMWPLLLIAFGGWMLFEHFQGRAEKSRAPKVENPVP